MLNIKGSNKGMEEVVGGRGPAVNRGHPRPLPLSELGPFPFSTDWCPLNIGGRVD